MVRRRAPRHWPLALAIAALSLSLLGLTAGPVLAAAKPITVSVAPATVHVSAQVTVTGADPRHKAALSLTLQRKAGRHWVDVAHAKTGKAGRYGFSVKASKSPASWLLRVSGAGAATSRVAKVRVVKAAYLVRLSAPAPVAETDPVVVTGSVSPRAKGVVSLQVLNGKAWTSIGQATLSPSSAFRLTAMRPLGTSTFRVVKAYSATVAAGTSATVKAVVTALPPPEVVTTALSPATVGLPYSATLQSAAGLPPYTWTATNLPSGLTLGANGQISGTPLAAATQTVTVSVTDALHHVGSLPLVLAVSLSPAAGNSAFAWGNNASGQLGDGTTVDRPSPVAVNGASGFTTVTAGGESGYGLRFDGTLWAWGDNTDGQLGNGSTTSSAVPVRVGTLSGVVAVSGGSDNGYALLSDGTVWSFGDDVYGELGNGPAAANSSTPVQVPGLAGITAIAAGEATVYALRSDGTVWSWGYGIDGELGNSSITNSFSPVQVIGLTGITAIAAGGTAGYALAGDGTVWSWGYGGQGELGIGSNLSSTAPVHVPALSLSGVVAISGGLEAAYALLSDGTVMDWGYNHHGELGNGTIVDGLSPAAVPGLTGVTQISGCFGGAYVRRANGTAWTWGENFAGSLGNGTTVDSHVPIEVPGLTRVLSVRSSADSESGFALLGPRPGVS